MQVRTEAEDLVAAPIKVRLGQKEYLIPVLPSLPVREWRMRLYAELEPIIATFKVVDQATGADVGNALTRTLIQFPEKVQELVFLYREHGAAWAQLTKETLEPSELAKRFSEMVAEKLPEATDFPRSLIVNSTEKQFASAFTAIMQEAFPYLPALAMAKSVLNSIPKPSQPATAKYSN